MSLSIQTVSIRNFFRSVFSKTGWQEKQALIVEAETWPEPHVCTRNMTLPYPMPLYFVQHPNDTYSVADPQPSLPEVYEINDAQNWSGSIAETLTKEVTTLRATVDQLKFIVSQVPMLDCPSDPLRFGKMVTKFCYVNPLTTAKYGGGINAKTRYMTFGYSKTLWVLTSLIPEGRILLSNDVLPGFESLLAEQTCGGK